MKERKKIVLITGARYGIGVALAKEFLKAGCKVYGTSRMPGAKETEDTKGIVLMQLNLDNESAIISCLDEILQKESQIDILVNNAGFGLMGPLSDIPGSEMKRQFEINFFAPATLNRFVIPHMINRRSGMIVNISSISGVMPSAFSGAYCATKAALNAYSDALRIELRPFGIKVITVQPGGIRSDFGMNSLKNLVLDKEKSSYTSIGNFVEKRAVISQVNGTPADEFARKLMRKLNQATPGPIIRIGKSSIVYPLMKLILPVRFLDNIISRNFGLNKLR